MNRIVLLVLTSSALLSCGKELGRVPFTSVGTATATAPLAAGEVAFWTDIDLEYEGDAALAYEVELSQGGAPVAKATCDPLARLSVKESWVETNLGASHSRHGTGKLGCSVTLAAGGPTTVKATLAFSRKPATVTLRKADLVVKQ